MECENVRTFKNFHYFCSEKIVFIKHRSIRISSIRLVVEKLARHWIYQFFCIQKEHTGTFAGKIDCYCMDRKRGRI
jgi:hypothetical protein